MYWVKYSFYLSCLFLDCPAIIPLTNGDYEEDIGSISWNKTVRYNCNTGYTLIPENDNTRTCSIDGVWVGEVGNCIAS